MVKQIVLLLFFGYFASNAHSQTDLNTNKKSLDIFNRIDSSIKDFKPDTTTAPDDKITRKIIELRNLRGGFNINEAVDFKIQEDRQKKEMPEGILNQMHLFFESGNGKRWLNNATIWIYRQHFNYRELKQLVKFYKTSAGKKMASNFPVIMMQSLKAAEVIKGFFPGRENKN